MLEKQPYKFFGEVYPLALKAIFHVVIITVALFLIVTKTALAADIKINEFLVEPESDQEVELFNNSSTSVDISGWFIDDDGGSQKYTIPQGTTLAPGGFKSFKSSLFNFNYSSADTVRLLNGGVEIDSKNYSQSPGANKSIGRKPDGSDNWFVFDTPSWDQSNNNENGQAMPTPTPEPASTPTPSPTPSPTSTTTATSTPTPSPKASPKSSPAATRSASPSASPQVLGEQNRPLIASDAGLLDAGSPASTAFQGAPSKKVAGILIVSGAALVLFALGFHLWYRKINKGKLLETKDPFQL